MIRVHHHFLSPFSRQEWQEIILAMLAVASVESVASVASVALDDLDDPNNQELLVELFQGRDGDIAALNLSRMGCLGPTNILSFPSGNFGDSADGEGDSDWPSQNGADGSGSELGEKGNAAESAENDPTLGTLFLSVDTLRRECLLYGQNLEIHAQRLLAHGLAHLLGYDHGPEMDELCEAMLEAVLDRA